MVLHEATGERCCAHRYLKTMVRRVPVWCLYFVISTLGRLDTLSEPFSGGRTPFIVSFRANLHYYRRFALRFYGSSHDVLPVDLFLRQFHAGEVF